MSGWPSRTWSRKPCSAGPNVRSVIESAFTRLMPTFRLITSAGRSRIVRATKGSSMHCPPSPRLVRLTPAMRAAMAGQVPSGDTASMQWLIERAVVDPAGTVVGGGLDGRSVVDPQTPQLGGASLGQPDLDDLRPRRQVVEADRGRVAGHEVDGAGGLLDDEALTDVGAGLAADGVVDDEVEAGRRQRLGPQLEERQEHVELDGGAVGGEPQPHARRHAHDAVHEQVGDLRPGPGRQASGRDAVVAAVEVEGADELDGAALQGHGGRHVRPRGSDR